MTDDFLVDNALGAVARRAMANALRREFVDDPHEWWEAYPEIGEHDWNSVIEWVEQFVAELDPSESVFLVAYNLLGARADAT